MVVTPRVVRRERPPLVVLRRRADELLPVGIRQRVDGAVEAELRERLRLALARAEAGAPEQPLGTSGVLCQLGGQAAYREEMERWQPGFARPDATAC